LILIAFVAGRIGVQLKPIFDPMAGFYAIDPTLGFLAKTFTHIINFFKFWQGGIDPTWFTVALVISLVGLIIRQKEPLLKWLDALMLPVLIFLIFFEIGGHYGGWHHGRIAKNESFFTVNYPVDITKEPEQSADSFFDLKFLPAKNVEHINKPIFAVQLYSAFFYILAFIVLARIWHKLILKKHRLNDGTFFGITVATLGFINGFLNFFRNQANLPFNPDNFSFLFEIIPPKSLLSFLIAFLAVIFLIFHTHEHKLDHPPELKKKSS
jgi:prolipoprotein diacylglyceryltransferase